MCVLWFTSLRKPIFPLFLRLPERKVLDPTGPYISSNQKYLSVDNFGVLSVDVWHRLSSYVVVCRHHL